jgi:fibronectin type 3 domain-containing protein
MIDNVTVQWCIISEGLGDSIHSKGYHSYGALIRGCYGARYSYHHNLFAHNNGRNPRPGNYDENPYSSDPDGLLFDFRNNVIYNWGGDHPSYDADTVSVCRMNYVGNYCKAGPSSSYGELYDAGSPYFMGYYEGNYWNGGIPADPYSVVNFGSMSSSQIADWKQSTPFSTGPIITQTAQDAYDSVLSDAGASLARDSIDTRIANEVLTGTVTYYGSVSGKAGIIDNESDVGGWPAYNSITAPLDTDLDGMPDVWEIDNGLSETNPADRNYYDLHLEYTNLEVYLNSLVAEDLESPAMPTGLTADAGNGLVDLDWDDNSEVDLAGYNVYRSTTSGTGYTKLNIATLISSDFTDDTAENGVTYFYVVTAVDTSSNESDISNEVFETPVDLNFYGDTNGDQFIDIADLPDFFVLWLESDCLTTSGWDINDDCLVNLDEFSLLASLWMLDSIAPSAPTNITANSGDSVVLLDWNDNSESDLAGYNIYRSESPGTNYVKLNTALLTASDYTDIDIANGITYYYVVTAVDNASNESDDSDEVSATPGALNPTIIIQEEEAGFCGVDLPDGLIESEHSGYTGTGYANTDNATGEGINYSVNILASGTYTFVFRYAGISSRPGDLIINDITEVEDIAFPSTGAWTTWDTTASAEVTLTAGIKTVRLEAAGSDGLGNIDYMEVAGVNLQAADCP